MYRRHGQKLSLVFLATDLVVTSLAWFVAYWLRFTLLPAHHGVPDFVLVVEGLPFVLLMAAIAYRVCGLYEIHRLRQLPRELGEVCKAGGLLFLLSIASAFYRRDMYESRLALGLFPLIDVALLVLVRRVLWSALTHFRSRGLNRARALIVGNGRLGRMVAETISNHAWTALEVVGYVDHPTTTDGESRRSLGDLDQLAEVIARHDVDHVFVALPLSRYGELPAVYRALSDMLVEVQLVPEVPQLAGMRLRTLEIDELAFLSLRANPHQGWHKFIKRGTDLVVGTAALVFFAPVMALLAMLIKLTSRGPVLYRQPRTGLGGKKFNMLKFRSMQIDAEQATGPVWASSEDPRCTSLGRFMRAHSLDELPQLFNVIAGNMSLVGPRPERGVFVEQFRNEMPNYFQRHQVKAGMTGWAQVNGWRGNSSLRRRLQFDLYYVAHWSWWFDLKILWLTIWCGFGNRHAY